MTAGALASWGRTAAPQPAAARIVDRSRPLPGLPRPMLPYGNGRSYGDSCLVAGGSLLDARGLDRFIAFDAATGVLACEAGTTLDQVIAFALPRGWFPAVVPGTRWITVGGAIANDVHGKNHHAAGTFGRHVRRFELLASDGSRTVCSREADAARFRATVGGLGLTGLITWAELQLARVPGPWIEEARVRFDSLAGFFEASEALDAEYPHVVAWIDAVSRPVGRGVLFAGRPAAAARRWRAQRPLAMPIEPPAPLVNRLTARAFNAAYFAAHPTRREPRLVSYEPFFFPLDRIASWNRVYGPRGFFQHQCVVPPTAEGRRAIGAILSEAARDGSASFLAVLKRLGDLPAEGLLSFPMPGYTLALDFPNRGRETRALLERLDALALEAGGRLYPAKDARMAAATFRRSFPAWEAFAPHVDPAFSSDFWRRVSA